MSQIRENAPGAMKLGDKVGESGSESTLRLRFGSL